MEEDRLTNPSTVEEALIEYKKAVNELNGTIASLKENRAQFNASYQSDNANYLLSEYDSLITNLTAAYASLSAYQTKIDGVVKEIIGFDETLQKEDVA